MLKGIEISDSEEVFIVVPERKKREVKEKKKMVTVVTTSEPPVKRKRGRPRKNPLDVTKPKIKKEKKKKRGKKRKEQVPDIIASPYTSEEVIECRLQEVGRFTEPSLQPLNGLFDNKTKKGHYHGSCYPIPGLGIKKWLVAINLVLDREEIDITSEKKIMSVIEKCINYLNQPAILIGLMKKKNRAGDHNSPYYGKLTDPVQWKIVKLQGKECLQLLACTNMPEHKDFWGSGLIASISNGQAKRRGRKKKVVEEK